MPQEKNTIEQVRPPVVVIMGHIDHGKSTLLDYIRKTNIVAGEAGGITQHISAYEFSLKNKDGESRRITFLDTPGHAVFSQMRSRGAKTADIAILVVSAEDGVKTQTIEAFKTITDAKVPCIVAINKIDKPGANIDRTKNSLNEAGIYVEGYGGDIPVVQISAKIGTGVDELLETILLVADLNNFTYNPKNGASGIVIESKRDAKRGITATLIIKDGTLEKGDYVVAENALTGTRILESFDGSQIKSATPSSPVVIVGWESVPSVGTEWNAFKTKKEAEEIISIAGTSPKRLFLSQDNAAQNAVVVPLVIKADVIGTLEAIANEIKKLNDDTIYFKVIEANVGPISENDAQLANSDTTSLIFGFHVKVEPKARDTAERLGITIETFDIIYKLFERLEAIKEERKRRDEVEEERGSVKILKIFGETKGKKVVGGRVLSGRITVGDTIKIMRRDFEIARGRIGGLQQQKAEVKEVVEGNECGLLLETKTELAPGDTFTSFVLRRV